MPETLKQQLAIGGRLIIPVGSEHSVQRLVCITRLTDADFEREDFGDVRFVPLLGEQGWS